MKRNYLKKNIFENGFTLVELMVAIAVFSIVMVVATGALLNVIDANQKAQTIKTAINNVNFALEGISKDMRVGTDYGCGVGNVDSTINSDCPSNGTIISYSSPKKGQKYVYYKYIEPDGTEVGKIVSRVCDDDQNTNCTEDSDITSPEVNITSMNFYVVGIDDSSADIGSRTQPRVIITLTGEAGKKEKTRTTFQLQTSISQRSRPIPN